MISLFFTSPQGVMMKLHVVIIFLQDNFIFVFFLFDMQWPGSFFTFDEFNGSQIIVFQAGDIYNI